jgi:hypothetical protein
MSLLPFKVLGDDSIRAQHDLRANVGRLCTPSQDNLERIKEMQKIDSSIPTTETIQYLGSVLYDKNWNIMKNDAVMLGTIHAKQPAYLTFNLETLRTMKDISFHSDKYIKVQFREILQLAAAGYKMVIPSQAKANVPLDLDNIIMINFKPENSSKFTMENLLDALNGIDSAADVREAIGNIEYITYEDYLQGKSPYSSDSDTKSITTLKDLLKPDQIERLSISDDSACKVDPKV